MPRPGRLERVKGTHDVLPPAARQGRVAEERLLDLFAAWGYRQITVPVLEHTDLYLRKSGEDTLARLYSFTYQNRRLSLRPELTASVVRAYIEHLQTAPLPVRLSYCGPVFRYEAPQRSRYRQFTQVGVELLGVAGAQADAESIALALAGLDGLEIRRYRLVIGHIGVLTSLLRSLRLDDRLVSLLAGAMETLASQGPAPVRSRLAELFPQWMSADDAGEDSSLALAALVQTVGEERARAAVLELLAAMNMGAEGSRSSEEIVDRVLLKFSQTRQRPQLEEALAAMEELCRAQGSPEQALSTASTLLRRYQVTDEALVHVRSTLDALDAYNVPWSHISLDFGLSRGLQYYTGLLFEIHHEGQTGERQLCGGGRYDDLVTILGGKRETPAIGFAYGLERVLAAMEVERTLPSTGEIPSVLLVPVEPADYAYAVDTAALLRQAGLAVELDVKGRGVKSALQHADRVGVPVVVIVGSREREDHTAVVRFMTRREERRVPVADLPRHILNPEP